MGFNSAFKGLNAEDGGILRVVVNQISVHSISWVLAEGGSVSGFAFITLTIVILLHRSICEGGVNAGWKTSEEEKDGRSPQYLVPRVQ